MNGMRNDKDKTKEQLLDELARLRLENEGLKSSEGEMKRMEDELRVLHEAASEGIMIHEKGVLLTANQRYFKMFGYEPEELTGKQVLPLTVVPESLDSKTRRSSPDGITSYEIKGLKKNGETFLTEVRGKLIQYLGRTVRGVAIMDITERKKVEEALRESEDMLRFLSNRLFEAQEQERSRLSKELHDQLGHDLVVLKSRLRSVARKMEESNPPLHDDFNTTIENIDRIIEDVRRISRDLKPSVLEDLGLFAAVQWLVENFSKQHAGISVTLDMEDIDQLFANEAQVNLYRILQESLTNISKHSEAAEVSVEVKMDKGCIMFSVKDNGKGFEMRKVIARKFDKKGVGLTAMKERMHMLGGSFDVVSQPGKGTCITFSVPIEDKKED
jgi:PAS domain S-box-containing protein